MNHHLSPDERYQIQIGLAKGLSIKAIAALLQRSPSTIYREIAKGSGGTGYDAKYAQKRALHRLPAKLAGARVAWALRRSGARGGVTTKALTLALSLGEREEDIRAATA